MDRLCLFSVLWQCVFIVVTEGVISFPSLSAAGVDTLVKAVGAVSPFYAGTSCPDGWLPNPHHDTCVKAFRDQVNWFKARDACSGQNSTLLHVDSDEMKAFINEDIRATGVLSTNTPFWIASNDIVEEGSMRSVFGRVIEYTRWDPRTSQPNDATEDGGPHTQNCVMDVVSSEYYLQQDKACASGGNNYVYICEMWPLHVRQAMFTRTAFGDLFVNYGVSPDADDDLVAESNAECALRCLKEYYSCDYILYSSQSRRCMLLRLYEADYSDAFTIVDVKGFSRAGYVAFKLNF